MVSEAMQETLRRPVRALRRGWRDRLRPGGGGPETFRATRRERDELAERCSALESEIAQLEEVIVSVPVALERRRCVFRDMLPPPEWTGSAGSGGRDAQALLGERRRRRLSRGQRRLRTRRRLAAIAASGLVLAGLIVLAAGVYYLIVTRV